MNDNNRATGRTFRKSLRVLLSVSEGKNVIYVSNKAVESESVCRYLQDFLNHQGISNDVSYKATRNSIAFGGGSAKFIGLSEMRSPSYRPAKIVFDDCYEQS